MKKIFVSLLLLFSVVFVFAQKTIVRADEFQGKTSTSAIKLNGLKITAFSIDTTFANPSDLKLPTQLAVKKYVMNYVAANASGLVQSVGNTATVNLSVTSSQLTATGNLAAINYWTKTGNILSYTSGKITVQGIDVERTGTSLFYGAPTGGSLSGNVFIGDDSGRVCTGSQNVTGGREAGNKLTAANGNLLFGLQSGFNATTPTNTIGLGSFSLYNMINASNTVAIGVSSGLTYTNQTGGIFIGSYSGRFETGNNTLIISSDNPTNEANNRDIAHIYSTATNMFLNRKVGIGLLPSVGNPVSRLSNTSTNFDDNHAGMNTSEGFAWATSASLNYAGGFRNTTANGNGLLVQAGLDLLASSRLFHVTNSDASKTSRFLVRGDGRVAIGTVTPPSLFSMKIPAATSDGWNFDNSSTQNSIWTNSNLLGLWIANGTVGTQTGIFLRNSGKIKFSAYGTNSNAGTMLSMAGFDSSGEIIEPTPLQVRTFLGIGNGNGIYGGSGSWGATNVTGTGSGLLFLKSEAAGVSNTSISVGNGTLSLTADDLTSADLGVVNVTNTSVQLSVTDGTTTGQISMTEKNLSLVANSGLISSEGTEKAKTVLKTSNYTVAPGDNLLVAGLAANVIFTLPNSSNRVNGQMHRFGNVTTGGFTVTIDGDGSDLVGTTATVTVAPGKFVSVLWSADYGGWLLAD